MRVAYIPEVVRNQMRDQIQQELMAQAREEKWSEKSSPDWTSKFKPFGDIRVRSENTFFPDGNDNSGAFPNFNAINTGSPFDTSGTQFSPQYNVDQDRHRARLRARVGTEIMLGDGFNGGIRLATGDTNSPTSTNQTLGGNGGNFSKYAVWLDRAFVSYDAGPGDGEELTFLLGRFDNPFFSTEIMWDDDLGFDGLALRGKVKVNDSRFHLLHRRLLPGLQHRLQLRLQPTAEVRKHRQMAHRGPVRHRMENRRATSPPRSASPTTTSAKSKANSPRPIIPLTASDAGDTDTTRPAFAQRGNTYMALRDIDNSTAANDFGNKYQYQYYGLASEFRNLTLTGKLDYDHFDPVRLSLIGEVTKNVAFDSSDINNIAVNNRGPAASGKVGAFEGGDTAWNLAFQIGKPALETLWDWQAGIGYRYVESDAVVDGFTDSDFGGGGTNVQGFTLGGIDGPLQSRALRPALDELR